MSLYTDSVDYTILEKIKADFFAPTNGIIGINLKGENKIIDNRLHLGAWAGPSADLFNLTHEMAHFIEIDNRRCHRTDWGLKVGKWVTIGFQTVLDNMYTTQAIERELRTFAIQTHLMTHYSIPDERELNGKRVERHYYMASLCDWIDAFYLYHKDAPKEFTYDESKEYAKGKLVTLIDEYSTQWDMDKITKAWFDKVKVLKRKRIKVDNSPRAAII